jgi:hypothetical protein
MMIIIEKDLYAKFFLGFLDLCFFQIGTTSQHYYCSWNLHRETSSYYGDCRRLLRKGMYV